MNTKFKPLNKKEQVKRSGILGYLIKKLSDLFTESTEDVSSKRMDEIERDISNTQQKIRNIISKN